MSVHAELHMQGNIVAGGSDNRPTDFSFHFFNGGSIGSVTKPALEAKFQTIVAAPIIAALNARWSQTQNTVRWVDDATDAFQIFPEVNVGAITGDSMPPDVAIFQLLKTGLRGKNYRGGKHFGPISESDTTTPNADVLNAGAITRFNAIAAAIASGFTDSLGNVWFTFVLSRTLSQIRTNPTTVIGSTVVSVATNKRLGRLDRRQVRSVY